jgi:RNA polymerase sigma factor (sigma-70 family)
MPSLSPGQDNEIIAASLEDPAHFSIIFDRHFRRIHAYLQRQLGPDLADELASQTFLVAFDKRKDFALEYDSALPWLFGIAANLARRHHRDVQRQLAAYMRVDARPHDDALEGAEERADASREHDALIEALKSLPEEYLETILLHVWAELSYSEIAQTLGIPLGTVQSRINRARTKVREQIETKRTTTQRSRWTSWSA